MPVVSCDPLRIWSRLEVRPRQEELDRPLEARTEDALWFLTRQWQFGEFHGSDGGSAISVRVARRIAPISTVHVEGAAGYDPDRPLEAQVERLPIDLPPNQRAQLGDHLMTLLAARLPATAPFADIKAQLRAAYPLGAPGDPGADPVAIVRHQLAGVGARVASALARRGFDGAAVVAALPETPALSDLPAALVAVLGTSLGDPFLAVVREFVAWCRRLYSVPPAGSDGGWDGERLGYDYTVGTADGLALRGSIGPTGRLDWYGFTVDSPVPALPDNWEVTGAIPRGVTYAGMPAARWWQLEDSAVSLAQLRADSTDIVKIVVTEFALVYGNDWLVVPYDQPVGTLAQIGGVVVTDVFGVHTLVGPATGAAGDDWAAWDLFSLSPAREDVDVAALGQHLFLPPVLAAPQWGPDDEDVTFVRDEDANMVWGVEAVIPDGVGGGRNGNEHAHRMIAGLAALDPTPPPDPSAPLRFVLGTAVPENWIPFVPVHAPNSTHAIRLQRAWTPRDYPRGSRVRPLSALLREGLAPDDTPGPPYYVNEEEVTRAGTRLRSGMRRARWSSGSTTLWRSRRRGSGVGEVASGLRFDVLQGPES